MSTQRNYSQGNYSQGTGSSRNRGFSPLFRGLYSDEHLRVSDAERQAVADRLAQHFADGRLDQAVSAKTRADLSGLFSDLPDTGAPAVPDHPHHPLRRRRHPVLIFVLLVLFIMATAHAVMWATMPWLWVAFVGLVLLFATGTIGRSRPGQDR